MIFIINKSVLEDSLALIGPQLNEVILILIGFNTGLAYALENFTYVSEIINIVRF